MRLERLHPQRVTGVVEHREGRGVQNPFPHLRQRRLRCGIFRGRLHVMPGLRRRPRRDCHEQKNEQAVRNLPRQRLRNSKIETPNSTAGGRFSTFDFRFSIHEERRTHAFQIQYAGIPLPTSTTPHRESVRCCQNVFTSRQTLRITKSAGTSGYPQVR